MKNDGFLLAPTFLHKKNFGQKIKSTLMSKLLGFPAQQKWDAQEYQDFLQKNNFAVQKFLIFESGFDLAYAVCHPL